ncbi:PAS domain-containing protein [Piscinibacter sp.]|uniref:hybrid sensor histidine kinase/response regulator n=1 Tax=Piscinibacter sp. TaxID=1903157 RepID=UPI002B73FD49|nr:PAS domain-containing protein [Albitalea sp.]HUG21340.1 PAS domain-containing protein [Albitalea sp.]
MSSGIFDGPPAVPRSSDAAGPEASSTQLALAVGLVGIGLWRRDFASRRLQLNARACELMGRAPEPDGLPEQALRALLHPDDHGAVDEADRQAVALGVAADAEVRCLQPDGRYRTLLTRRVAERDAQGRAVALVGVVLDITEQRATQLRLHRAEQRTLLAAKAVGLALWESDLVTGEWWWDAQMYRLRGLSPDDARTPNELRHTCIHPDDVAFVERRTAQIIEHESDYSFDFRVVWPDGSLRWLAARGSVTRDESGRALAILGFNWDITEHKRGEDMRREKKAAEQASRAKSEFLSRMSHELRTPLNAVLGFAQLMIEDPSDALAGKQRERVQHIHNAGRHLLALIDDVLDLTSVDVGTLPLAPDCVALAPLVREMMQWLAPAAQQAGVTLSAGAIEGAVMADARRLRQVLANLLTNAVKYNRPGGRVEVRVIDDGDVRWLGIGVRDTGRGLTDSQRAHLFEPFNRLGAEREGIEGTGIGLTIVRALVERMRGRVEVDTTVGRGSDFRVWLERAQRPPPSDEAGAAPPPALAAAGRATVDVLYIEDNELNVLLVRELVALRPQVRLHVAVDGRSGIARSRELRPRAVLIDLELPDIDGWAVLRALRADPALSGTRCIALSANAMPEDVARVRRSGFDDYWTKPIDFTQFLGGLDGLAEEGR